MTLIRTRKEVKHLQAKKISAFEDRYITLVPIDTPSNVNLVVFKKHDFEQQPKAKLKKAAKKLSATYSKIKRTQEEAPEAAPPRPPVWTVKSVTPFNRIFKMETGTRGMLKV